ncbi:MAG: hypothetical protein K2N56_11235 [Oscillospiraceae bacterium]|nr:hypothetical protein [Oscillospiraceae bacterium]
MDTKNYLESLRLFDARIEQRIKQLDDLEQRRSFLSSNGCSCDALERGCGVINDLKTEISEDILQFEMQRNDIINKIQSLNDHKLVRVLFKRYVEYKPFEQVAAELGYVRSHTLLLHRNALAALESALR